MEPCYEKSKKQRHYLTHKERMSRSATKVNDINRFEVLAKDRWTLHIGRKVYLPIQRQSKGGPLGFRSRSFCARRRRRNSTLTHRSWTPDSAPSPTQTEGRLVKRF